MRTAWAVQGVGFLLITGVLIYLVINDSGSPVPIGKPDVISTNETPMQETHMRVRSPAFGHEELIPSKYSCDGEDISPPLAIDDAPESTASFVLIMDDPDSPTGTWDHWIVFNIPGDWYLIGEGSTPEHTTLGVNSWGRNDYGGPCPGKGEHRYLFKVYALDTVLRLQTGASKQEVEEAMQGHILERTTLMGRYEKVDVHYED